MDRVIDLLVKPGAFGQRCGRSGLTRRLAVVVGLAARIVAARIPVRLFKDSVVVCVVRVNVVVRVVARPRLHRMSGVALNRGVVVIR
eukprot:6194634-Pleurochrysis_carterae.AAC.2